MATERNSQLIDALGSDFRKLYNPAHAFADAIGMLQMLPGLVGLWPCNKVGSSSSDITSLVDISDSELHLTAVSGGSVGSVGLAPYLDFNGSSDYFSHVDASAFDIIGNESNIITNGLTMGMWINFSGGMGSSQFIGYKWAASNQSYLLYKPSIDSISFAVSNNGTATTIVHSDDAALVDTWYFVCGRYIPSTEIKVYINNNTTTNTTSIPATLYNGNSIFALGGPTNLFNGNMSLAFLCKAALSDSTINTFFQFTAPLFGVTL